MAWNEQSFSYSSYYPAFISSSQPSQSSQYATDEPSLGGQRAARRETGRDTQRSSSAPFQTPEEQISGVSRWTGHPAAGNGQWNQCYQPNGYSFPDYASLYAAQPNTQYQPNNCSTSEQTSGTQTYSQYGHINPAFYPQQPMANTAHSASTAAPKHFANGYRRSHSSFEPAHNGGQWPGYGYGYGYQTDQISLANSQTQTAGWQQPWPQYQDTFYQNKNWHKQNSDIPKSHPTETRYAPQISQPASYTPTGVYNPLFGNLINPVYTRSPQLTPSGENPRLYLLPRPEPTPKYLQRAQNPSRRLSKPKKLLIVLDLNGTLLVRNNRGSSYTPRPNVQSFLRYCLEHHSLVVWSSARPHNVTAMVDQLFTRTQKAKLIKVWSREHLHLGKHYDAKVQVYKQLTWLWEDAEVQASFPHPPSSASFKLEDGWKEPPAAKWDQSNTVLLDDSVDKAASEPHNLLQIDEFTKENMHDGQDVLGRVLAHIEGLRWEADVSSALRERPFVNGEGDEWDWEGMCARSVEGVPG